MQYGCLNGILKLIRAIINIIVNNNNNIIIIIPLQDLIGIDDMLRDMAVHLCDLFLFWLTCPTLQLPFLSTSPAEKHQFFFVISSRSNFWLWKCGNGGGGGLAQGLGNTGNGRGGSPASQGLDEKAKEGWLHSRPAAWNLSVAHLVGSKSAVRENKKSTSGWGWYLVVGFRGGSSHWNTFGGQSINSIGQNERQRGQPPKLLLQSHPTFDFFIKRFLFATPIRSTRDVLTPKCSRTA